MSVLEFQGFPSIKRLSRDIIITEKLDGTNAQIYIELRDNVPQDELDSGVAPFMSVQRDGIDYVMLAGSRTRWLGKGKYDNFGFGEWVGKHSDELLKLGPGRHFGEWYGKGIQRGYGLTNKRFSLFNVSRWKTCCSDAEEYEVLPGCCGVVPILYKGPFTEEAIYLALDALATGGSVAAPGFMDPEGIVVFHTASNTLFKKTFKGDEKGKGV
jgi:hypothetical protein